MHAGVLNPVTRVLEDDRRMTVWYVSEHRDRQAEIDSALGRALRWLSPDRAAWARIDLFLSADPWGSPQMHRCATRMNFLHGVAGKYDLDDPSALPIGFDEYDKVAFINEDRMRRYLASRVVRPGAAVLVGFPKADALVNGEYDGGRVRERLALDPGRPTAIYAPTWSPASSLHIAGEKIVTSLVGAGWNVIIRPHARSLHPDVQYSGGVDWRQRLRDMEIPQRVVVSTVADASPELAASDLMVTDHSTIGFEFCLLNRPLIVFDAPDLPAVARINPERIALLRSAARVVDRGEDVGRAANEELANPEALAAARRAAARALFYDPGAATKRALDVVYELLRLKRGPVVDIRRPASDSTRFEPSIATNLSGR